MEVQDAMTGENTRAHRILKYPFPTVLLLCWPPRLQRRPTPMLLAARTAHLRKSSSGGLPRALETSLRLIYEQLLHISVSASPTSFNKINRAALSKSSTTRGVSKRRFQIPHCQAHLTPDLQPSPYMRVSRSRTHGLIYFAESSAKRGLRWGDGHASDAEQDCWYDTS